MKSDAPSPHKWPPSSRGKLFLSGQLNGAAAILRTRLTEPGTGQLITASTHNNGAHFPRSTNAAAPTFTSSSPSAANPWPNPIWPVNSMIQLALKSAQHRTSLLTRPGEAAQQDNGTARHPIWRVFDWQRRLEENKALTKALTKAQIGEQEGIGKAPMDPT